MKKQKTQSLRAWILAMTVLLALLVGGSASAQQTTADILGTVVDNSGAVVAGATVVADNTGTNEKRTVPSGANGEYVLNLLKPGAYKLTITAPGFKVFVNPGIQLAAGDRVRVDAHLQIGQATETVTVESAAPALRTDSSVLSSTIVQKAVEDLPLNGRNFVQLVQLQPGANDGLQGSGLTSGNELDDRRQTSSLSVNGQSDVLNNQMVDGIDNNERLIGSIGVRPAIDAIGEVRVQTNTYTAEVGRTGGGIVNLLTKSGTNEIHGTTFEYFRNDKLDTYPYTFGATIPKSELRQNQFGGSIGGPIIKDKTFFFGDYEGFRLIQELAPTTTTVPTLAQEQDPTLLTGSVTLDKAGLAYFNLLPAPNSGTNKYVASDKKSQFSHVFDVRVDHQINPANSLFARVSYNNVLTDTPGNMPKKEFGSTGIKLYPGASLGTAPDKAYNFLLNYVHTFNPNLLMELKGSFTRVDNEDHADTTGLNPNAAIGQKNVNTDISEQTGLAYVSVSGGAGIGFGGVYNPVKDMDNTFQYAGSLTWNHGPQSIKVGSSLIRRQLTIFQSNFGEGLWVFLGYGNLLEGNVFYVTRQISLVAPHLRVWEPSAYIQDDWHVAKNLTVNIGIRYDLFTPFTEINHNISTFNPDTGNLMIAGKDGVSNTAGIKTDYSNLAPRFGFAYTVRSGTVLRGGFGIGYVPMNTTSVATLKNDPFVSTYSCYFCSFKFAEGLPSAPVASQIDDAGSSIPDAVDPHFRSSAYYQYNLTAQQDFSGNVLTVSYVGILGRHLAPNGVDVNQPTKPNDGSNLQQLRPYYSKHPNLGNVSTLITGATSVYSSLQTAFERRFKNGLVINANYTLGHQLDDVSNLGGFGGGGYGVFHKELRKYEWGNGAIDIRHRIAATANYQLPFYKNSNGWKKEFLAEWQVNAINVWSTGLPFSVVNASSSNVSGLLYGGADRPNQVKKPQKSNPGLTGFFDTTAFEVQPTGTYGAPAGSAVGTVGTIAERRDQIYGPHYRHLDLSLFKNIPLTNRYNLEFRAEGFNVTNTTNFAGPDATMGDAEFGNITSTNSNIPSRQIQFAMKLHY